MCFIGEVDCSCFPIYCSFYCGVFDILLCRHVGCVGFYWCVVSDLVFGFFPSHILFLIVIGVYTGMCGVSLGYVVVCVVVCMMCYRGRIHMCLPFCSSLVESIYTVFCIFVVFVVVLL